jgi:hypothetical protein
MKAASSVLLVGALIGCGGRQDSTANPGAPNVCASPNCCVPIALSVANVRLYSEGGSIRLLLTVERVDAAGATNNWFPSVSVTTASGETLTCDNNILLTPTERHVRLQCETPTRLSQLACGDTTELQIRIHSSSVSATGNSAENCDGSGLGITLSYTVPLECPTCPNAVVTGTSCDLPMSCTDGWNLPCYCSFDSTTGKDTWFCAIS